MKSNYHTHTLWCDGADTAEAMAVSALAKGFGALGFSPHMAHPLAREWELGPDKACSYVSEIRELAGRYAPELLVFCGGEADYIRGRTAPDRSRYASMNLDYLIGSVHFVTAPDGAEVPVDASPQELFRGIREHFSGDAEAFVRAYFACEREMLGCDFDVVAHPDLVRKFNVRYPYFDSSARWYREELEKTADALASSGKTVEVNTGAISRGWLDDAYPSAFFRRLLRERGVSFILSSDAHGADAVDCAFERFAGAEEYVQFPRADMTKGMPCTG